MNSENIYSARPIIASQMMNEEKAVGLLEFKKDTPPGLVSLNSSYTLDYTAVEGHFQNPKSRHHQAVCSIGVVFT